MASADPTIRALSPTTYDQRRAHGRLACAGAIVSEDVRLLPTDVDAELALPEEPGDNLTPGQRLAVAALVSGETFAAAARAAGVSRRTVYDWRQLPDFTKAVDGRSREALGAAVIRVRNLMLRATRVMGESMLDRDRGGLHAFRVLNSARLWRVASDDSDDKDGKA